jgi:hypothetical protein
MDRAVPLVARRSPLSSRGVMDRLIRRRTHSRHLYKLEAFAACLPEGFTYRHHLRRGGDNGRDDPEKGL